MTTKEKIQQELDELPDELLEKVHQYLTALKKKPGKRKKIKTYKLGGRFDNLDIRRQAYE